MDDAPPRQAEGLVVIRSAERFVSRREGITTWHSFSFGDHYDPDNVSFGPLVAFNEELLEPGAGYAVHEHRDLDIVTWVVEGTLAHEDPEGRRVTVTNGTVQRLTAGNGVRHSEVNAGGPGESLRLVQLWFRPGADGDAVTPSYETWTLDEKDDRFGFTTVAASGTPRGSATLSVPGVRVRVGHLVRGSTVQYGTGARGTQAWQLYVAGGRLDSRELGPLGAGDAVRSLGRAGPGLRLLSIDDAVVLTVELDEVPTGR
ncbi:MAG: pirin family protein [Nocardioidaceae bacterium]